MLVSTSVILIPERLMSEERSVSRCRIQRTWSSQECSGQESQELNDPLLPTGPPLSYHTASKYPSSSDR